MVQLCHRIVEHLEGDWPQTLWQWDLLEAEVYATILSWEDEFRRAGVLGFPDDHLPEPASAIMLARSCDVPSILPSAFYHLSRLSIDNDRHTSREAPSTEYGSLHQDCLNEGQRTADWALLSTAEYISLLRGRRALTQATEMWSSLAATSICMHTTNPCDQSRQIALITEIRDACRRSSDVLEITRKYMSQKDFWEGICEMCSKRLRGELHAFRQSIWTNLPAYFSL